MFNPVAPYLDLLSTVYMAVADITNPGLSDQDLSRHQPLLLGAVPAIQRVHMAGLPKMVNQAPIAGGGRFQHNLHSSLPKPR